MNNKNVILTILGGIGVAAAIICWLLFGGSAPKNVELGEGVKAKFNASGSTMCSPCAIVTSAPIRRRISTSSTDSIRIPKYASIISWSMIEPAMPMH